MTDQPTKGPWHKIVCEGDAFYTIVSDDFAQDWQGDLRDGKYICDVHTDEADANILEASYELLLACEQLLAVNSYWWQEADGADDAIRAAVAKARGKA